MNADYSVLADYYDKFTHNDCNYAAWSQYLCDIARRYGAREVVDLACGTGKMSRLLAESGLKVTGVDVSAEMLSKAAAKCRATFVLQDMRRLSLPHKYPMAVCVNDGVNYVSGGQLTAFFGKVADNLSDGAPFVFDISSEYKLRNLIGNNVFYWDGEYETLLWSNRLQADSVTMELALFVTDDGARYTRRDERHTQYIHTRKDVTAALIQAGFGDIQVTSDYGNSVKGDDLRLTFAAIKGASAAPDMGG